MAACHRTVRCVLGGDALPSRGRAELDVVDQLGVAPADLEVGLGQHHAHVADDGAEERPALDASRRAAPWPASSSPASSSKAVPTPYHAGIDSRHCDQPNTHGMARRSSMRFDAVRDAGRDPMFRREISPIGRDGAGRSSTNPGSSYTSAAVGAHAPARTSSVHGRAVAVARARRPRPRSSDAAERRGDQRLEVAARRGRMGVLGGDHLTLLGDPQRAVDAARRLGQDRLVGRSAAPTDGAAAAVEQAQPDAGVAGDCDQLDLRLGTGTSWR